MRIPVKSRPRPWLSTTLKAPKSFDVTVGVSDSKNEAGTADTAVDDTIEVTITLTNVNEAPVFDLEPSGVFFNENQPISTVVATFSATDPDAGATQNWSLSGPDASKFTITTNSDGEAEVKFKTSPDYENPTDAAGTDSVGDAVEEDDNEYWLHVTVSDGSLSATSSDFTVEVRDVNEAPAITSTANQFTAFSVEENTATTMVIKSYVGDDPEEDALTWSLTGEDANDFTISSNATTSNGELKFRNVPDFENPADEDNDDNDGTMPDNVYKVTINVRDGKINTTGSTNGNNNSAIDDSIMVTVTVTNEDEPGTVTITGTGGGRRRADGVAERPRYVHGQQHEPVLAVAAGDLDSGLVHEHQWGHQRNVHVGGR